MANGKKGAAVAASEFTRNFGTYKLRAQKRAVPVSSHGKIAGYFIGADEYEDYLRHKSMRISFATADLPLEEVEAIGRTRMHPRHNKLNALLRRR